MGSKMSASITKERAFQVPIAEFISATRRGLERITINLPEEARGFLLKELEERRKTKEKKKKWKSSVLRAPYT